MDRGRAITVVSGIVLLLLYFAYSQNVPGPEDSKKNRQSGELILPKRRSSEKPSLLSADPVKVKEIVAAAAERVSPRESPNPFASLPPAGSLCTFFYVVNSNLLSPKDSNAFYMAFLASGPDRNPGLELLHALVDLDTPRLETFDLDADTAPAREISLLARLGMLDGGGNAKNFAPVSVSATDLDRIEEMKVSDPGNAFWPMLEYAIKKREGIAFDSEAFYEQAKTYSAYRNPLYSFYTDIRRPMLSDPNQFYASSMVYSRAPITHASFTKPFFSDVGKSPEWDASLGKLGNLMERSAEDPTVPVQMDGVTGVLMDAVLGRGLARKAANLPATVRSVHDELSETFRGLQDTEEYRNLVKMNDSKTCDEGKLLAYYRAVKKRMRRKPVSRATEKASANSKSWPARPQPE